MQTEASASGAAPSRPLVLDWEHAKIGDRLAAFTTFLPARPAGRVLLAVSPMVAVGLQWRFDNAVLLTRDDLDSVTSAHRAVEIVRWDGRHVPLRAQSIGLLIVDERHGDPDLLRPLLAPGATMAVLGSSGDLIVYPEPARPENIWRRGWPTPPMSSPRAQLRRAAGVRGLVGRKLVRLQVSGPAQPSLADEVLGDLRTQTGRPGQIVGVQTAGDTILRVREPGRDLAVRLSLTVDDRNFGFGEMVADEVPAVRHLVQRTVAQGRSAGVRWIATDWLPRRSASVLAQRQAVQRQWEIAEELAAGLQGVRTDTIEAGWAAGWSDAIAPIIEPGTADELRAILDDVPLGTPTGWAHGDLWPGNVLVDPDESAVIDWENCARNAPLGVDWVLIAALRSRVEEGISVAAACARMITEPGRLDHEVGGRPWRDWARRERAALVTAAYVLHLRNRALFDLGFEALDRDVAELVAAARAQAPDRPSAQPLAPAGSDEPAGDVPATGAGGRAARGVLWLGASALVVKALQTVVLLVLAAVIAPDKFGLIAIGSLIMNISTVMSDLGTSSALVYFRGNVRRAARSAVTVAALLGLAITALAWVLAPTLTSALHADAEGIDVIRGLTSVLVFQAVATVHLELMRRKLQFARRIVPDVVAGVIGAVVSIVLATMGHGVSALVIGQIVQGVLTLLVAWAVSQPVLPGWNLADVRVLVGYGGHLSGSNLAQLALLNVDYVIVSRVLGGTALGQYSIAFRLAYLPYLNIAVVIGGAAFPYLCRLSGAKLGASAERIAGVTITAVVPLCAGIALLANQLELLGQEWKPAVTTVRWLMVYTVVLSAGQLVQVALNSSGRPRTTLGLRVLHVCALVAALVVLTKHGIGAVAVGQVLAVLLVTVVSAVIATRCLAGFSVTRLLASLGPALLGVIVMSAVVLGLAAWLPGPQVSGVRLIVLGLAGVVAYVGPVWYLDRERIMQTVALMRGNR